jgi:hypothetical protein
MKWIVLVLAARTAYADRCEDGVKALAKNDLPRAALYLDGCDESQPAAVRELKKKLNASELSVLEVVTRPDKLDGEIDALPGEKFTTPATLYIPAGTHEVHAGGLTNTVTTKPHSRTVVILEGATQKKADPKDGRADFREDSPDAPDPVGPPPPTPHRPMMPCKFTNSCTDAGDAIDDPLAREAERLREFPSTALELRAGSVYADAVHPALGVGVTWRLPWQDDSATHPWLYWGHGSWSPRDMSSSIDAMNALGKVVVASDTTWLLAGLGGDYDSVSGVGAATFVEIALRKLPITLAATYEQHFDAASDRALIIDLGVGLRSY